MKIIVQDLAVEYDDVGSGPVLIFLHGWQDNLHSFDSLISFFSKNWRLIRIDLPGFGASEKPRSAWSLDEYVNFVSDFIEKLKLENYILIGHSFGGRIIIKGESIGKFQAKKVVLIGSAGIKKRKTAKNIFLYILAKLGKFITVFPPFCLFRDKLRKKLYGFSGSDYVNAGSLKDTFVKIINEDLSQNAKKIKIPVLLIWGEGDTETPLSDGEKFSQYIKNSKLEVVAGVGHFVHKENPKKVIEIIQNFLC